MKSEVLRVTHELQAMKDKIKENTEKIKVNKTLPYLVSNVIEVKYLSEWGSKELFKSLCVWDLKFVCVVFLNGSCWM